MFILLLCQHLPLLHPTLGDHILPPYSCNVTHLMQRGQPGVGCRAPTRPPVAVQFATRQARWQSSGACRCQLILPFQGMRPASCGRNWPG